jgi:hypothetical protein
MENNPTAFEICMENLVKRGCYVQNADQLIGIVLNVCSKTIANAADIRTVGTHPLILSF